MSIHEPARAHENEVWMVCADKAGQEEGLTYPGHSQVIHPDGTMVVQGSQHGHEIVYADIDTEEVAAVRQRADSLMRGRRPESYKLLSENYEALPYATIAETPVIPSRLAVLASPTQICNVNGDATETLQRALKRGDELRKGKRPADRIPGIVYDRCSADRRASAKVCQTYTGSSKVIRPGGRSLGCVFRARPGRD